MRLNLTSFIECVRSNVSVQTYALAGDVYICQMSEPVRLRLRRRIRSSKLNYNAQGLFFSLLNAVSVSDKGRSFFAACGVLVDTGVDVVAENILIEESRSEVREGKLEEVKVAMRELVELIKAKELEQIPAEPE
jgi:hypothetical protein